MLQPSLRRLLNHRSSCSPNIGQAFVCSARHEVGGNTWKMIGVAECGADQRTFVHSNIAPQSTPWSTSDAVCASRGDETNMQGRYIFFEPATPCIRRRPSKESQHRFESLLSANPVVWCCPCVTNRLIACCIFIGPKNSSLATILYIDRRTQRART